MQRVARKGRKAVARLAVVLQVLRPNQVGNLGQILSGEDRSLLGLVIVKPIGINREAHLKRTVERVGMGDSEHDVALQAPELRIERQRFALPQEVVGLVVEPHKTSRKAAHAPCKSNRVLALFLHLQIDVHRAVAIVRLHVGIFRIELLKIVELIQPKNA
jgi:hypothetical protein